MTALGRSRPTHVLANAPFRRLWMAMSVCSLGDWLNLLALTALAGNLTQGDYRVQSLAVGGVFVAKMLPAVLLGPLAGVFADRFDRRLTMFCADLARFAVVLSIPFVGSYQWLIIATVLVECVNLFWVPAKEATVPNLVPKAQLESANQLNLLVTYGTAPIAAMLFAALSVAGDLIAGIVPFPLGRDATGLALIVNACAYLVSAFLIFTLRDIPKRDGAISTPSVLKQVVEGWRFVGRDRLVRGLVIGMLGAFAAGGAVVGVAKVYVEALGGGDAAYGVVFGAVFVGMALGMFFGLRLLRELSRRRLFGLAITVAGLVLVAIALVHNLVIVVMLTVVLGACAGIAWIIGYTLIGLEVDDAIRGRTFSFLQSTARVTLLLVVSLANPLAAIFGLHVLALGEFSYRFDGTNLVLLIGGALAVGVGVLALRHMDDRKGISLAADLIAAVRGEQFPTEAAEHVPGLFVAFEGGEGSGKTTQSRLIAIWLRDQGFDVVQTREPGSTKIGMRLRAILLDAAERGLSARSEALLYAADRAEHVEKVIRPALYRGSLVITDRYVDSSLAYQGAGRALDPKDVSKINAWATGGLVPHLTVLIDTPPEVGLTRLGGAADRIESEPLEFHERVRKEFRALAAAAPERYVVVDGTLPQDVITRQIQDRIREILPDPVPRESEDITGTMPAIRD
ncbi:dTMP kinase [Nonomuraea thailandensis]|uniref:Thymidylate kinase n=1 Tax=Nonomuraea thailandensis TaxID=1188745 RepID=A0A9X2KAZ7_9ACTN|nr:dTMP kinase [Nonomuraea thailandensis]MCP2363476.1 dTMP kinase [Nonomuraea thailandensis]